MLTRDFKFRVWYKDTDQMGIVHHSNYICYYEAARSELLRSFGSSYADMEEKDGVMMPILEVHSKYLRPAHYDELITFWVSSTAIRGVPAGLRKDLWSCWKKTCNSRCFFTNRQSIISVFPKRKIFRIFVDGEPRMGVPYDFIRYKIAAAPKRSRRFDIR